ncbi:MAG: hypothetical protein BZY75_01750 [SAR202 cluster bacterium Io17-Chloro-G7]|nr:MAG: hypothetical protein BZY75_01750 [SAR202 cluster bacterium Io17-Chloro-G7]
MVIVRKPLITTLVAAALLIPLILVTTVFGDAHTKNKSHQIAGDYTLALPVLSGPPVTENGVTTIAGTIDVENRGTQQGVAPGLVFTCVLGVGGAPNVCEGSYTFEGTLRGRIGTYKAVTDRWTSGGDEAFASAHFVLVPGSGTGDLSNLVEFEVTVARDEAVERRVGTYWGTVLFEGDESPSTTYQIAGDYTLALPVLSGPPVTEDGVTTIAGTIDVETKGSQIGVAPGLEFTCVLGVDGAPNVCEGSYVFEGSVRGRIGTYKAVTDSWTSGGDAAFASAHFVLVPGSGTGDLSNMVEFEVTVARYETVERRVGAYWGTVRFEGDSSPSEVGGDGMMMEEDATKDLSDFTIGELFEMEKAGDITTDELAAELERRNQ